MLSQHKTRPGTVLEAELISDVISSWRGKGKLALGQEVIRKLAL